MDGIEDEPKEGENHDVHAPVHENQSQLLKTIRNPDEAVLVAIELTDRHLLMTNQLKAQEEQALQLGGQQALAQQEPTALPGESPPRTPGEAAGDIMSAEEGGLA
jgi:hypothetical protein